MAEKEYIEREATLHRMKVEVKPPFAVVRDMPAADVVKVQHGAWFFTKYVYFSCSKCGASYYNGCDSTYEAKEKLRNGEYHNYCPNCGAKMDGKGENDG